MYEGDVKNTKRKKAFNVMAAICTVGLTVSVLFTLISSSFCLGHRCSSNLECSTYESCCGNTCKQDHYCLGFSCFTHTDCGVYGSCCGSRDTLISDRKCRKNCTSAHCSVKSDCGRQEHCCNNKCTLSNCDKTSCDTDSDCENKTSLRCCGGICSAKDTNDCLNNFPNAAGSMLLMLVSLAGIICLVFLCFCLIADRQRLGHHGDELIPATQGNCQDVTNTRGVEQLVPPPYPGQDPPPYHVACQDYPPPQYERHQTTVALPSHPESTRRGEVPPPYSTAKKESSRGVAGLVRDVRSISPAFRQFTSLTSATFVPIPVPFSPEFVAPTTHP